MRTVAYVVAAPLGFVVLCLLAVLSAPLAFAYCCAGVANDDDAMDVIERITPFFRAMDWIEKR